MNQQVITLTNENSIVFLIKYLEYAQKNGVFENLADAKLIKNCINVINTGIPDINVENITLAKNILFGALDRGQKKGVWSLSDASIIVDLINYIDKNINEPVLISMTEPVTEPVTEHVLEPVTESVFVDSGDSDDDSDDFDLSDLAKPVPINYVDV